VNSFVRMLIHSLRVSVGDLKNVEYQNWADNPDAEKKDLKFSSTSKFILVQISWGFWVLNIYLVQIILLNLLIA
jgi:hypothetical protein